MDQYGRPEYRDWMGLTQGINAVSEIGARESARAEDEGVKQFFNKFANGTLDPKNFDLKVSQKEYNPETDALSAQKGLAAYFESMKQNQEFKAGIDKNDMERTKVDYRKYVENLGVAESHMKAGDDNKALKAMVKTISEAPGPYTAELTKDNKMKLTMTEEGEKKDVGEMTLFQAYAKAKEINEEKFPVLAKADLENTRAHNKEAMLNPSVYTNGKDVIEGSYFFKRSPEDNKSSGEWFFYKNGGLLTDKEGNPVTVEDVKKQGFVKTDRKSLTVGEQKKIDKGFKEREVSAKEKTAEARAKKVDVEKLSDVDKAKFGNALKQYNKAQEILERGTIITSLGQEVELTPQQKMQQVRKREKYQRMMDKIEGVKPEVKPKKEVKTQTGKTENQLQTYLEIGKRMQGSIPFRKINR